MIWVTLDEAVMIRVTLDEAVMIRVTIKLTLRADDLVSFINPVSCLQKVFTI